jgi:hypothetical protein
LVSADKFNIFVHLTILIRCLCVEISMVVGLSIKVASTATSIRSYVNDSWLRGLLLDPCRGVSLLGRFYPLSIPTPIDIISTNRSLCLKHIILGRQRLFNIDGCILETFRLVLLQLLSSHSLTPCTARGYISVRRVLLLLQYLVSLSWLDPLVTNQALSPISAQRRLLHLEQLLLLLLLHHELLLLSLLLLQQLPLKLFFDHFVNLASQSLKTFEAAAHL